MRIALMGTRGIPASYSGFETCVEQLGQRLVQRGYEVTVFCRSQHIDYPEDNYKGMHLIKLPTVANKYLDTIVHSFLSSLYSLPQRYDVILYFIAGNSPTTWIPRVVGTTTILNVDGLDWKREKWPLVAKKYIQSAEFLATKLPSAYVTDSLVVQAYYREKFNNEPPYIAYGSDVQLIEPRETLARFKLQKNQYLLFVGRLVPENCVHHLVDAFKSLDTDLKCVIVGDSSYEQDYVRALKEKASDDSRIVFTGYVFGKGYNELGTNSLIFVETSEVGGTHPALIEAMSFGNCVVVNDTAENLETIGAAGFSYHGREGAKSLSKVLNMLIGDEELVKKYSSLAAERARKKYSWKYITDEYERLFLRLRGEKLPERLL